jgi:hypothetical protein
MWEELEEREREIVCGDGCGIELKEGKSTSESKEGERK